MAKAKKVVGSVKRSTSAKAGAFVLGRAAYKKVAAVEGLTMSRELEADFRKFDSEKTPASKRRAALAKKYAKTASQWA